MRSYGSLFERIRWEKNFIIIIDDKNNNNNDDGDDDDDNDNRTAKVNFNAQYFG